MKRLFSKKISRLVVVFLAVILVFYWIADRVRRESLSLPLLEAVHQGDVKTVQRLLEQGADPDARMHEKINSRSLLTILHDLFTPRNRNRKAGDAPTALLIAAQYNNNPDITRLLLQHGAHIEWKGEFGYEWQEASSFGAPLIAAACNRHAETAQVLLEYGADPNARSRTRQTALMFAAVKGEVRMAQMLLKKGADPNARDRYGNFPLLDAVDWFQRYENSRVVLAEDNKTPLTPDEAHLRVIELLVASGADLKSHAGNGSSLLAHAAYGSHPDIVRFLLAHGADPKKPDKEGWTPLHFAVETLEDWETWIPTERKLETARLLLDGGADIQAKTKNGDTALSLAINNQNMGHGKTQVVRFLLSRGADSKDDR